MFYTSVSKTISSAILAALFAATPLVQAGSDDGKGKRRGPPPIAFEVCQEQDEGAVCSFEGRRGDLQGTCIVPPRDVESAALVCAPERNRRKREDEEG